MNHSSSDLQYGHDLFFRNELRQEELRRRLEVRPDDEGDLRGPYFRDTTAIVHSHPFRRMKNKTQVFFAPRNDHVCTRIEHVMHVATIAATISRALNLDPDLAWAIGVGHDLGHTPFGHLGETIIGRLGGPGGFRHEIYGLRVVDRLAHHGRGLNLTYAVRDGIINHCGEKFEQHLAPDHTVKDLSAITQRDQLPSTWEGVVVRMSDKIAYLGRDLEDAVQLGLVDIDDVPEAGRKSLGTTNSSIIDTLVNDLIAESLRTGMLGFSDETYQAFLAVKEFNYHAIYNSPHLASYHTSFERVLTTLHGYLTEVFERYELDSARYREEGNTLAIRFADYVRKMQSVYERDSGGPQAVVIDYIAGMTDRFAIESVQEIMVPQEFSVQFDRLELGLASRADLRPL